METARKQEGRKTAQRGKAKRKLTLTHFIFIALFLGVIAGKVIGEAILPVAEALAEIFLRLLRMAILPLVITSIISGMLSDSCGAVIISRLAGERPQF